MGTSGPRAAIPGGAMEGEAVATVEEAVVAATPAAIPAAAPMQAEDTKVAEAGLEAGATTDSDPTAGAATNLHGNSAMFPSQTIPISPSL